MFLAVGRSVRVRGIGIRKDEPAAFFVDASYEIHGGSSSMLLI